MSADRVGLGPGSWWHVAPATALGLYAIVSLPLGQAPTFLTPIGVVVAVFGALRRFPVWSLPALGWLVGRLTFWTVSVFTQSSLIETVPLAAFQMIGIGLFVTMILVPFIGFWLAHGRRAEIPRLAWPIFAGLLVLSLVSSLVFRGDLLEAIRWFWFPEVLLVSPGLAAVALGALLARRHGVAAGLVVIGAATVPYLEILDPENFLARSDVRMGWVGALAMYSALVLCPTLVLRARTIDHQRWGILGPWGVAVAAGAILPGLIRLGQGRFEWDTSMWFDSLAHGAEFFLVVLLAVLWYERIARTPPRAAAEAVAPQP